MFLKEAPLGRVVPLFCSVIPCEKRVRHFVFFEPGIEETFEKRVIYKGLFSSS